MHAWEERLPKRVLFGEVAWGNKDYSFGQEKHWVSRLEEDLKELGIKSEGCREAEQTAGR